MKKYQPFVIWTRKRILFPHFKINLFASLRLEAILFCPISNVKYAHVDDRTCFTRAWKLSLAKVEPSINAPEPSINAPVFISLLKLVWKCIDLNYNYVYIKSISTSCTYNVYNKYWCVSNLPILYFYH
jgi:hypothetical protein